MAYACHSSQGSLPSRDDAFSDNDVCLQAALDRFAFMTSTTALGVIIALQPLALLKKHIQVTLETVLA